MVGVYYPVAWLGSFYVTGEWPQDEIDHANGVRHDDAFANLREATRAQNNQNRRGYGRSGVKGAFWVDRQQKWRASIKNDGRVMQIGLFDTAEAAGEAYAQASREQYGSFARAG